MLRLIVCVGLMLGAAMIGTTGIAGQVKDEKPEKVTATKVTIPVVDVDLSGYELVEKKKIRMPITKRAPDDWPLYKMYHVGTEFFVDNSKDVYVYNAVTLKLKRKMKSFNVRLVHKNTIYDADKDYIYKINRKNGTREKYIDLSHLNIEANERMRNKIYMISSAGYGDVLVLMVENYEETVLHAFDLKKKKLIWKRRERQSKWHGYKNYLFYDHCALEGCAYILLDIKTGKLLDSDFVEKLLETPNGVSASSGRISKYGLLSNGLCSIVRKDVTKVYKYNTVCKKGEWLALYNNNNDLRKCKKNIICQDVSIYRRKK